MPREQPSQPKTKDARAIHRSHHNKSHDAAQCTFIYSFLDKSRAVAHWFFFSFLFHSTDVCLIDSIIRTHSTPSLPRQRPSSQTTRSLPSLTHSPSCLLLLLLLPNKPPATTRTNPSRPPSTSATPPSRRPAAPVALAALPATFAPRAGSALMMGIIPIGALARTARGIRGVVLRSVLMVSFCFFFGFFSLDMFDTRRTSFFVFLMLNEIFGFWGVGEVVWIKIRCLSLFSQSIGRNEEINKTLIDCRAPLPSPICLSQ